MKRLYVVVFTAFVAFGACRAPVVGGLYMGDPLAGGTRVVNVSADNLDDVFNYVNEFPGVYTFVIDTVIFSGPQTLNSASELTIIGERMIRNIQFTGSVYQRLLTVNHAEASLILGENIVLQGINESRDVLVSVNAGSLVMRPGSKITGHRTSAGTGVVLVSGSGAVFIMEGGEITGNYVGDNNPNASGGLFVQQNATFIMKGGSITGNKRANPEQPDMDLIIWGLVPRSNSEYHGGVVGFSIPENWDSRD